MLFLVFDKAWVRPGYIGREKDSYIREARRAEQLVLSLQLLATDARQTSLPIYVCVGGERDARFEARLVKLGAIILPIRPLPPPPWASSHYRNNFNKLSALNLTQFSRVIVMDNDCVVLKNIDHLASPSIATPAAACHPRRKYKLCSFNFGVHVLTPSKEEADRLVQSYQVRGKLHNNGGEQEVWANFHKKIHELPIGYNAHHGLEMPRSEWDQVHVIHAVSGHGVNRLPEHLNNRVRRFDFEERSVALLAATQEETAAKASLKPLRILPKKDRLREYCNTAARQVIRGDHHGATRTKVVPYVGEVCGFTGMSDYSLDQRSVAG